MVPYVALWVAMYYSLDVSYLLTLLIAIPAAGFLVRTFIVFHDCGHGSFMPSKRLNRSLASSPGCSFSTRIPPGPTTTPATTRPQAILTAVARAMSKP